MKATQRIRRSNAEWAKLLAEFDTSGLPTTTFCQQRGIAYGTFMRRRRRVAEMTESTVPPGAADWLPIDLARGGEIDGLGKPNSSLEAAAWDIELILPGGVQLRMRAR